MLKEYLIVSKINMTEGNMSQEFRLKNRDKKKKIFDWRNKTKWTD